jgi:hypothetical protein
MKRNCIFAFTLLAMLFMVNAVPHQLHKRATTKFLTCPLKDTATLTVSMTPDPIVQAENVVFSAVGTLGHDVTAGTTFLAIIFADATGKKILNDAYFQVFTDSFPAGSTVSITAPNVPAPQDLPSSYTIGVGIGDPDLGNPLSPLVIYGCTYAVVGGT